MTRTYSISLVLLVSQWFVTCLLAEGYDSKLYLLVKLYFVLFIFHIFGLLYPKNCVLYQVLRNLLLVCLSSKPPVNLKVSARCCNYQMKVAFIITIHRLSLARMLDSSCHYLQVKQYGGDYMIPFSQGEISTSPAGTDFTQRLHGEINFYHGKAGQFRPGAGICLKKAIYSH